MQTLTARASELERDFGFGVVRQLLETRLARASHTERTELLTGAAALAAPVLGLSGGGDRSDPFTAVHGLYWLVANLALGGPVVMAVDDLHWADEPSLRWLIYLCHRLEGLSVLVAITTRPPRAEYSALLTELLALTNAQIVCPSPLTESSVAQLLVENLGVEPEATFVGACLTVTGGNPLMLRSLVFDLAAYNVAPVAAQASSVAERGAGQVERVVLARLRRLDPSAAQLAQAMAVLGEGTELRRAARLARVSFDAAAASVDELLTADLLIDDWPLRFTHPLIRSAIYKQMPPGERSQAHARAARLLAAESAEPEQVAGHLLNSEPAGDADAVAALRVAATVARRRNSPDTAITYLRRALDEPPTEGPVRAAVLTELGCAEKTVRDPTAATHLEQARQATTEPTTRGRLAAQLAALSVNLG